MSESWQVLLGACCIAGRTGKKVSWENRSFLKAKNNRGLIVINIYCVWKLLKLCMDCGELLLVC